MSRCAVYRVYDIAGRLLYIGSSTDPDQRMVAHRSAQPWSAQIHDVEVIWYPDEPAARNVERQAIEAEAPRYNVEFTDRRPDTTRRRPHAHEAPCRYCWAATREHRPANQRYYRARQLCRRCGEVRAELRWMMDVIKSDATLADVAVAAIAVLENLADDPRRPDRRSRRTLTPSIVEQAIGIAESGVLAGRLVDEVPMC